MGLYDNNLFYAALCIAVLLLQLIWIKLPVHAGKEYPGNRRADLAGLLFLACVALASATLFRLFPGNHRVPAEDSSVFLYIGKRMTEGKLPYRDLFDHKGPVLYWIESAGIRLMPDRYTGVWLLEVLNLLASVFLMHTLGRIISDRRSSVYLAVLLAVGVCGWKVWQGGNYTEEYALPWITLAACVFFSFFRFGTYRKGGVFILGLSMAAVFLLRANMIAVWASLMPLVLFRLIHERRFRDIGICLLYFLLGMAAVFLPALLWLYRNECLNAFWRDYFLFNFAYTGDASSQGSSIFRLMLYFAKTVWPGTLAVLVSLFFGKKATLLRINAFFYAVSLLTAAMSGRGYYHYAIVLLPAMILPFSMLFDRMADGLEKGEAGARQTNRILIVLSGLLLLSAAFAYRRISSGAGEEDPAAVYLRENSEPDDDVLVLGNGCWYYLLTDRKTENRFFYQLPPLEISDELYLAFLSELKEHPSDLILIPGTEEERDAVDSGLRNIRRILSEESDLPYAWEDHGSFEVFKRTGDQ